MLAGYHSGKVRALLNERGQKIKEAGPSTPALILGFNGTPQAGDRFSVTATEQEAKEIATKRQQLQREQGLRTNKHITLDEIGRRLAIGNFRELKLIVKGDVDGSVEALSDALLKLSTEEIAVNVIHKSVGQITESDVLLASASDAIIIGFRFALQHRLVSWLRTRKLISADTLLSIPLLKRSSLLWKVCLLLKWKRKLYVTWKYVRYSKFQSGNHRRLYGYRW